MTESPAIFPLQPTTESSIRHTCSLRRRAPEPSPNVIDLLS
jgi:hypothetical protein